MDISSFLFGSTPSANMSTMPTMSPEQQAALKGLLGKLQAPSAGTVDLSGAGTSLTALEQAAQSQAEGGTTGAVKKTLTDIMSASPEDINKYFTEAVSDPAMKQFQQQIIPQLTAAFPGMSGYGSDRALMVDKATQDLVNALTSARASTAYNAYQANIQNKLGAASGLMGAQTANINDILAMLKGQLMPAEMQQQAGQANIGALLAALNIRPFENMATVTQGQPGLFQGMAPGLGAAGSMYMMNALMGGGAGAGLGLGLTSAATDIGAGAALALL